MKFADRIQNIEESKSVRLSSLISQFRSSGKKVIGLNIGEPDFSTPDVIIQATKNALDSNYTRYGLVEGIIELRQAIASKVKRDNQLDVTSENIFLGNGSKHILYNLFQTLLNDGDEVIIPAPYWVTFPESVKLAGGRPVFVKTINHQLDLDFIKKAITPKTRAIIINSPNNPTGAVYPETTLRELSKIAKEKDFYIISDEAYEALLYDDLKRVNIGSFDSDTFKRTITVQSFSKSYCMTGFRIGYMVAHISIIKNVNKLQGHLSGNNCTFAQYGALAALEMSEDLITNMVQTMELRRNLAYKLASEIFEVQRPQGAFYLFPNIQKYLSKEIPNDEALAEYILKEANVAVLPGNYYGAPGFLRICFSASVDEIKNGFGLIKDLLCK